MPDVIWKGSPNFNKGRKVAIDRIVIHWFGVGTLEAANARFQNPANQVSAHYGISKNRIWQWVDEKNVSWHSGNAAMNGRSIGIEHDAIKDGHALSEQDYRNSAALIAEIAKRHSIPLDRAHVIGHSEVKPTACPGTIDIDRLIAMAKAHGRITTKVSLYRFHAPDTAIIDAGLAYLNQEVARVTVGEFIIQTQIADAPGPFSSRPAGLPGQVMVVPDEILALPSDGRVVCLVYDAAWINGYPPTNPFHTAMQRNGVTPIQIPTQWFAGFAEVFADYYLHELLHAWCYLTGAPDKVHSPGPNWGGTGKPLCYYLKLLLELRPYWPQLAYGQGVAMPQIKTQAKGASRRIILEADGIAEWKSLCKVFGKNFADTALDEKVKDA